MSGYRGLSEPTHSGEADGEWVDFPASPDPDPWGTLLRQGGRVPPEGACGGRRDAGRVGGAVGRGVMAASAAIAVRGLLVTAAAVATIAYLLLTNSHI
jgi:hypothetical protein